ncbi:exported hypothetical protein [Verrucomicrobia bacterium]|nr:exported hypothetical protein [Verrucomicrobiota bacterium]
MNRVGLVPQTSKSAVSQASKPASLPNPENPPIGKTALRKLRRAVLFCLLLAAPSLQAHPISIITIEALVHRDRVEMKMAVMPEDFLLVYGLYADAQSRIATEDIVKCAEKHKQFLLAGLIVRDAEGNRLEGKVVGIDMPSLPKEGLPVTDLMATTILYRLEIPLTRQPTHLTFQQNFGGGTMMIPAIVTLVVTREGLPPEPAISLPGDGGAQTVAFDWKEPSRSAREDYAAIKAREEEKRAQNMGISSYSATYTFVYIENEEVRVEILVPLLTLEMWQPVARANPDFIEVSEQTASRRPLGEFFAAQNELKIDGMAVKPKLDRLDFYGVDFKDFAMRADARRLSAWTARVGAILTYSTKGAPGHIELKWTLFNNEVLAARAVIFAYDKEKRFTFSPRDPVFKWDNPGAPPLPAVTAISTSGSSGAVAAEALLRNVYRAFDYHSESDIYDALARSVQGDLLAELYLKIKRSLIMEEQGGAVARVQEVKVVTTEPREAKSRNGFAERITWQVEGTVEHWGHIHLRVNEYSADLEMESASGAWKITALNVSRQSQVKSAVLLRKL